ncbi:response regulator transcription factor [Sphingomonas panacisoli]|uniref:Response regulator transcription factor n=1 Tax=Sphingomonas panacisoli TaxID=1813879 RepID=A0A5B8LKG9_9SPHN|nr:response regulator transcription factor [Sphingomonas panacisoli]QDZ08641.1 response regulator transcription factor [Sphingomonas panacisoli]
MSRLLIVDDHPIFLDGLRQFLETNDHHVALTARTPSAAMNMIEQEAVEVLITDVSMSEGGGLQLLRTIRSNGHRLPVIFLTVGLKPIETMEAVKLGVNGIVLKHSDPTNLLTCIDAVTRGETWIDPTILESALRRSLTSQTVPVLPKYNLTRRQEEIVRLVGDGLRNKEIAQRCGLTEGTVKLHLHRIYTHLGIQSRAQLIMMLAAETM